MGKGFYISKAVGIVGIVLGAGAVATIIALSVVYSQEKSRNQEIEVKPTEGTSTTNQPTTPASNEPWDSFRLPDTLIPESYDVTLWPRLKPNPEGLYIFTGISSVVFKCVKETDLILIHANKLNLTSKVTLSTLDGSPAPSITSRKTVDKTQYFVFHLSEKLKAEKLYKLHTEFQGELANDLGGFYRSEYEVNNVKKVVATTQMQPTDARKAFPCFDEPAMKAYFNITLLHEPGTTALSNGQEIESVEVVEGGEKLSKTRFETTRRMSTYLLAFIVSDFKSIEDKTDNNISIRIFAREEAINAGHGDYAMNITGKILKFFEDYYSVPYPLSKSDQVALPDFNAGAMENWGLITYRETALLYDSKVSSNGNKERVATIIAHELAHMWFGNLVTIKWWNDLWLNEGFASYVEYLGANEAEPSWNITDLIVLNDVHRVFAVDALASSHPLSSKEDEVLRPEQISEVFDAISYSKGASVLRMLSDFLSEPVFVKGLTSYLNHFKFGNTVYTDLWTHLQEAVVTSETKIPGTVSEIMDRWVLQMGFPVVTIDTVIGEISQKHFLLDPESVVERPSPFGYEWIVPIQWMKSGVKQDIYWLKTRHEQNNTMKMVGSEWLVANLDVSGYYRVNYDMENWKKLLDVLQSNHKNIRVINRAQIIDDAFNLARAKMIPTTLALNTTLYLSSERDYMPWESALDNLNYFYLMFDRTEIYGLLQSYTKKQVGGLFEYFKNTTENFLKIPESHMDQYNEVNALRMACSSGIEECKSLVISWFEEWRKEPSINPIHPNLRSTVYCQAIAAGGVTQWDFAWSMFKSATIATEAENLRAAMACSTTPWILNRYLTYTLDPEKIRKQDATSTIVYVANNVVGQPLAWDFIRANWEYIYREYGGGSFSFANLINGVTKRFSTEFELKQLEQFRKDNEHIGFGSGSMAIEQSIEKTKANIKWRTQNEEEVTRWLEGAVKL